MPTPQRSYNMSCIRAKDTKPEMIVRHYLWANGFRYRLNHTRLPGKPDVVLRKYRTCVFVNGCFWHGHNLCLQLNCKNNQDSPIDYSQIENSECCKIPKSNTEFWVKKIVRNHERDISVQQKLAEMGWHCITIWECELKPAKRQQTLEALSFTLNNIFLKDHTITHTYTIPDEESSMAAEED